MVLGKEIMQKKILTVVGITILFLGTCITPSVAIDNSKKASIPIGSGNILYVGGTGPGNYSSIKDAIDNASDGDTVYVYNGIYHERVKLNKAIKLFGEDRDLTIIDGGGKGSVIKVTANRTHISGFTIKNGGWDDYEGGINSYSSFNKFYNNKIIENKGYGIYLNEKEDCDKEESNYNSIYENIVKNNGRYGITIKGNYNSFFVKFRYNAIYKNIVIDNKEGGIDVASFGCNNNILYKNEIKNNSLGIDVWGFFNLIIGNNITNNKNYGIRLYQGFGTLIRNNNFIDNDCNAIFADSLFNRWVKNYWDDKQVGFGPKIIKGAFYMLPPPYGSGEKIPLLNFDWRPARNPYDL
jgi:parallel beta-helix repeat protein